MTPAALLLLPALFAASAASASPPPPAPALPQGPDAGAVVARFSVGDERIDITRGDLALEMAFHLRRQDEGRAAVEHLVDTQLVRSAARAEGVWPAPEDVRALWNDLKQQLRAAGRDPEREAVVQNSSEATLLDDLAVTLAHEKLVRKQLGLRPKERVSPDMLRLWTADAKQNTRIVDDPDRLPIGTAARVGDTTFTFLDLGLLLLRTTRPEEIDRRLRQVAVITALERLAKQEGIVVTQDDLRRELDLRRRLAESDPRFGGMTFEALLKTQGLTPEWLLQSRVFRAQTIQRRLAAKLHPKDELLREIAADREAIAARHGARRRLGVVFSRALEEPNELVPRDFAAAREHLLEVRKRLERDPFDLVARVESDDPATKARGGDVGWQHRRGGPLPENVLDAAFALDKGEITEPIRGEDGYYLVKVLDVEPEPTDAELADRLFERRVDELAQRLLREARITRADGTPLDGDGDRDGENRSGAGQSATPPGARPGKGGR